MDIIEKEVQRLINIEDMIEHPGVQLETDINNNNNNNVKSGYNNKQKIGINNDGTIREKVYCVCRRPYKEGEFMIMCDTCEEWFHGSCVAITQKETNTIEEYECAICLGMLSPIRGKKYLRNDPRDSVEERRKHAVQRRKQMLAIVTRRRQELQQELKEKVANASTSTSTPASSNVTAGTTNSTTTTATTTTATTIAPTIDSNSQNEHPLTLKEKKGRRHIYSSDNTVDVDAIPNTIPKKLIPDPEINTNNEKKANTTITTTVSSVPILASIGTTINSGVLGPKKRRPGSSAFNSIRTTAFSHTNSSKSAATDVKKRPLSNVYDAKERVESEPNTKRQKSDNDTNTQDTKKVTGKEGSLPPELEPTIESPTRYSPLPPIAPPVFAVRDMNTSTVSSTLSSTATNPFATASSPSRIQMYQRKEKQQDREERIKREEVERERYRERERQKEREREQQRKERELILQDRKRKEELKEKQLREQIRKMVRQKLGEYFNAEHCQTLENYLFVTYGVGLLRTWSRPILEKVTKFVASTDKGQRVTNNLYVNKYFEVMERLDEFPSLINLVRLGELDLTKILYVSSHGIVEATRKIDANAKLLQQLSPLVGETLAQEILEQTKHLCKKDKDKSKYRDKIRELMFNLHNNRKLVESLVAGDMRVEQLVRASNEELASEEISKYRNKVRTEIAQAQIIHEKLTDIKREGIIKKQVEVKPDDIPISEVIVKEMVSATTVGVPINNARENNNLTKGTNINNTTAAVTTTTPTATTAAATVILPQSQDLTTPNATASEHDNDESSEDDDDDNLVLGEVVITKSNSVDRLLPSTGGTDIIDITNEEKNAKPEDIKDKEGKNVRPSVTETIPVRSKANDQNTSGGLVFGNRNSDDDEDDAWASEQIIKVTRPEMDVEEGDNVDFVGLFDEKGTSKNDDVENDNANNSNADNKAMKKAFEDAEQQLSGSNPSLRHTTLVKNESKAKSPEKSKDKNENSKSAFLNAGMGKKLSRQERSQKLKQRRMNKQKHKEQLEKEKSKSSKAEGKNKDKHALWKGHVEYQNASGKSSTFRCKMYQFGGDQIYRLPISPKSTITMTGRIAPKELEKHLLKTMKHSRRKMCCLRIIPNAEHEKVANECEEYLRSAERCARFKLNDKHTDNTFDLYIMSPNTSHINAEFVRQYFKCHLPRHTLWGLAMFPSEVYAKISQNSDHENETSTKSSKGTKDVKNIYSPEIEVNWSEEEKEDKTSKATTDNDTQKNNDVQTVQDLLEQENSDIWSALNLLNNPMQSSQPTLNQNQQPYGGHIPHPNTNRWPNNNQLLTNTFPPNNMYPPQNTYPQPMVPPAPIHMQPVDPRTAKRNRM